MNNKAQKISECLSPYSVLMPLAPWESPNILEQSLLSLETQSFRPSQVVVSCDGPPPLEVLSLFKSSNLPINTVFGPGNEGVGPVLARGLMRCTNELILRVDADDICLPQRAFLQVQWMIKRPNVLVMSTPINEFIDSPTSQVSQRLVPFRSKDIKKSILFRNPINHPSVIFRKSAVLKVGNYRCKPAFEDYDLWLRIIKSFGPDSIANISTPLVLARVGEQHLHRRRGWKYARSEFLFIRSCIHSSLLPPLSLLVFILFRMPLRLFPSQALSFMMKHSTRKNI